MSCDRHLIVGPDGHCAHCGPLARQCRVCGCTEDDACEGGCAWVEEDLCSECDVDELDLEET